MKVNNEHLRAVNYEYLLNCDTKGVSLEQNVSMLSATYVIAKSIKEGGSQSRGIFFGPVGTLTVERLVRSVCIQRTHYLSARQRVKLSPYNSAGKIFGVVNYKIAHLFPFLNKRRVSHFIVKHEWRSGISRHQSRVD